MKILIIPGTNGCASEVINSISTMKGVELYGGGSDLEKSKSFPYREFFYLPDIEDRDAAIAALINIISFSETTFDFVFFTHDQWIYEVREIPEMHNTVFLRHNPRAIQITSFKSQTYKELMRFLRVPKVYLENETIENFPIYAKPDRGQGSRGGFKIESEKEFKDCVNKPEYLGFVYTEFLGGPEYTIDCFSGTDGKLLFVSPRVRSLVSGGISLETKIVVNPEFAEVANVISNHLKLSGAWFFQMKEGANQSLTLLEVGLRPAGASGIQRLLGVNQAMAWIYQASGNDVKILETNWSVSVSPTVDGKRFLFDREFNSIFVDFDDTLIVNDQLNTQLLGYLGKSRAAGVHVALISRHKGDLRERINVLGIADFFDDIFHLVDLEPKSSILKSFTGFMLFIDDSFSEREEVTLALREDVLALDQSFLCGFLY